MHIGYSLSAGLAALALVSACSQTETSRSEEQVDTASDSAEAASSEADAVIEIVENHIRSSYEDRGISVVSVEMALTESGDYAGEAILIDPDTNERVPLNCTGTGVEGGAEDINCVDGRANDGQASVSEVDTLLQGTNPAALRDEILGEMGYALNGSGWTNRVIDYSQQGNTVSAIFETTYADGDRRVESRCTGQLRDAPNGGNAIAFSCRRPL